ncbi:MAG: 50S ribosomal protein L18 [Candidatus Aenigmarchaeota archaeon]|nr:50S ribosomal protein L18 [Candidatus Aenigmarchaeota archaeon]
MFIIAHKRRRQQKTDLKRRLGLIKSGKTRLVIRKSLSGMSVQFIDYVASGDKTIVTVVAKDLKKLGWNHSTGNIPSSYLIGLIAGKKAKQKNITEAVLDFGLQTSTKGSRIYAALKGVVDAGINVPHSEDILPSEDRLSGKHIQGVDVSKSFEEMKNKILG